MARAKAVALYAFLLTRVPWMGIRSPGAGRRELRAGARPEEGSQAPGAGNRWPRTESG